MYHEREKKKSQWMSEYFVEDVTVDSGNSFLLEVSEKQQTLSRACLLKG